MNNVIKKSMKIIVGAFVITKVGKLIRYQKTKYHEAMAKIVILEKELDDVAERYKQLDDEFNSIYD